MPPELTNDQIADIRALRDVCAEFNADFVIIGAIAYKLYFPDEDRFTADIDAVKALDIDEFGEFTRRLEESGWKRDPNLEHRWRSRRRSYFDMLPAGPQLRRAKRIVWPKSQFIMNLVGFDHVFAKSVSHQLTQDLSIKTIPPVVLALTKIVSFVDDPHRRAKDLTDIRSLLVRYEEDSDRIFDEVVFEAALADIGLANAFLLGLDLAQICTVEEMDIMQKFASRFEDGEDQFALQISALKKGLMHER